MKHKLLYLLLLSVTFSQAQLSLVKDINPGSFSGVPLNGANLDTEIIAYQNKILFMGITGREGVSGSGRELFVSDGTSSGTSIVKDIRPGSLSSTPKNFFFRSATNEVYFSATPSGASSQKLFKTNGTNTGTIQVTSDFDDPKKFIEFDNRVFFNSGNNGIGTEFSFTNGMSLNGSYDLNVYAPSGNSRSSDPGNFTVLDGSLLFSADFNDTNSSSTGKGRELGISDGTFSGTRLLRQIKSGTDGSDPNHFIVFNNKMYFTADNGINGREIWVTNGTLLGTSLLQDLNPGANGSNPENFTIVGNRLYFSANNGTNGNELYYMTTGENIVLYRDINPGSGSSNPSIFIKRNSKLFFTADNGVNGRELWSADGTVFGVSIVKDINPGSGDSNPDYIKIYNNKLYFSANDGSNGIELYTSNGDSASTTMIENINPGSASSDPRALTVSNDILFFHAFSNDGNLGRELYKYVDPTLSAKNLELLKFKLFPNPTNSFFKIESNQLVNNIDIYDVQGQLVKSFNDSLDKYSINELNSGIYFVEIQTNNTMVTKKIIKQ